ncbi:hypothetical protein KBD68_03610 [Candidatus Woesebacteria bacterium]|jgi:hypothetical protein|nr:hypothetical protein [Candidatus Woesebacteria bacterium]
MVFICERSYKVATEEFNEQDLIGLTEEAAKTLLEKNKIRVRVARRDLIEYARTMDWAPERVNLEIENGFVVKARFG